MRRALTIRKPGMDFNSCRGPNPATSIARTAAPGKPYVWLTPCLSDRNANLKTYLRQAAAFARGDGVFFADGV